MQNRMGRLEERCNREGEEFSQNGWEKDFNMCCE